MNTQLDTRNSNLFDITTLLDQQLDALKTNTKEKEAGGPPGTAVQDTADAHAVAESGHSANDLPFLSLDPYVLDGKDGLPAGTLEQGAQGGISAQAETSNAHGEQQVGFGLEMMDYTFRTSDGTLDIMTLAEERTTEIRSMTFNGQQVAVEYQSGLMHEFQGNLYDNQFRQLYIEMASAVGTTIQAETFDQNGNPILTAFGQEQMLEVYGKAFDYGIEEFEMMFELAADIQLNDFGMYEMTLSVVFEGEIIYLNGAERSYLFEDEMMFLFSDLDQIDPGQFPQGFYEEIARFAAGMGDAWDALGSVGDHLEAVLLQLREDGHYQQWEDVDQGLENPFDFNLPSIDPFA